MLCLSGSISPFRYHVITMNISTPMSKGYLIFLLVKTSHFFFKSRNKMRLFSFCPEGELVSDELTHGTRNTAVNGRRHRVKIASISTAVTNSTNSITLPYWKISFYFSAISIYAPISFNMFQNTSSNALLVRIWPILAMSPGVDHNTEGCITK